MDCVTIHYELLLGVNVLMSQLKKSIYLFLLVFSFYGHATNGGSLEQFSISRKFEQSDNRAIEPDEKLDKLRVEQEMVSLFEHPTGNEPINVTPEYLVANPDKFEELLSAILITGNSEALKALLPIYAQIPTRDPYVIDWGNAIILMTEGKPQEAVAEYRNLISVLPDNELLRWQLAIALYQNNEFIAAKHQFQKLRSATSDHDEIKVIEQYIDVIDGRDSWSFSGSLSYLQNDNITNSAPKGTIVTLENGTMFSVTDEPKSGRGFSYSLGLDKTWALNDKLYSSLDISTYGNYYFNNKNYNDSIIRLGVGLGYRTVRLDVQLNPFLQKRWYGQGDSGDGSIKSYSLTPGLRLNASYWLNPQWQYQGAIQYGKDNHIDKFKHLDGHNYMFSNTMMFMPNQKQYFYSGLDFSFKSAKDKANAYDKYGIRLGWGQEWPKGISSSISAGYALRKTKGRDFLNIRRKDREFNASVSVWHRSLHLFGITPRLVYTYDKTKSNNPLYEFDNSKIFIDFRKTF